MVSALIAGNLNQYPHAIHSYFLYRHVQTSTGYNGFAEPVTILYRNLCICKDLAVNITEDEYKKEFRL